MSLKGILTSGFSRFGWTDDSYFNREGWSGLWLPKVLQGVEHKCATILFRSEEVDILIEHQGVRGIERPL